MNVQAVKVNTQPQTNLEKTVKEKKNLTQNGKIDPVGQSSRCFYCVIATTF